MGSPVLQIRIMHMRLITVLLATFAVIIAGCSGQQRTARVGETGNNSAREVSDLAVEDARKFYDFNAPKTGLRIRSEPPGALVDWMGPEGRWITVGSTPSDEITIEATGKPELFRVYLRGYLPQTRWVAATTGSEGVSITFQLERELPGSDRFLSRR